MARLPPVLEQHFREPRHGVPAPAGAQVGRSENSACGDLLELGLVLDGERIDSATFQARACSATIAVASLVASALESLTVEEARSFDVAAAVSGAGGLPPTSRHAIDVVRRALLAALAQPYPPRHS